MKSRSALSRLRKIKTQSALDKLSKEAREFILNYDGPECSGSDNPKYKITYKENIDKIFTGLYDDNNEQIFIDDILYNIDGYYVIVKCDNDKTDYHGVLICDDNHSCKNIEYCLNKGKGHLKINGRKFLNEIS